jgi:hypothetical protein
MLPNDDFFGAGDGIYLYNGTDYTQIRMISGVFTLALGILSDGRIVAGGSDTYVRIFTNEDSPTSLTVWAHASYILSILILADDVIVCGDDNGFITVWTNISGNYSINATMKQGASAVALISLSNGDVVSGGVGGFTI